MQFLCCRFLARALPVGMAEKFCSLSQFIYSHPTSFSHIQYMGIQPKQAYHVRKPIIISSTTVIKFRFFGPIRTILHRMEIGIMASGMITLSPVLFMQWVRMVFGPMPQWFCWFLSLWRNCPTQCTLMFLDALVLFRVTINFDSKIPTIFKNTSFFSSTLFSFSKASFLSMKIS